MTEPRAGKNVRSEPAATQQPEAHAEAEPDDAARCSAPLSARGAPRSPVVCVWYAARPRALPVQYAPTGVCLSVWLAGSGGIAAWAHHGPATDSLRFVR